MLGAMVQRGASRISVNKEDILIGRGANPRTGIISPFSQEEPYQAGEENDYIHVRGVHRATNEKTGAHEPWRQDALGWSLIECLSDRSSWQYYPCDIMDGVGTKAVQSSSWQSLLRVGIQKKELGPERNSATLELMSYNRLTGITTMHPKTPIRAKGAKVTTLPKEIYRVPRKQVGSAKIALMSVLVEVGNWDAISSIESPRLLPKNRHSSPLLPVHTGAEDAILGYHAFPYVSLRGEQINPNKFIPRPSVKQFDKSGVCEPCDEEQM